jgi:hypothetical protein
MNKNKIILTVLVAFHASNHLISAGDIQNPNGGVTAIQNSQITELLSTLKIIQAQLVAKWIQFLDKQNYPDMSLDDLGNDVISILKTYGQKLPDNIRNNLIALVEIKKKSTSTTQFRSGHVLINDTMILLIDELLSNLHHETTNLLKLGVPVQDISTIKRALNAMRKTFDSLKRSHDYCGIETTLEKLTALIGQLRPILESQLKRNKINLSNSDTQAAPNISGPMLLLLLSQRIALNNK